MVFWETIFSHRPLDPHNSRDLLQKPGVDFAGTVNLLHGQAITEGLCHSQDSIRHRLRQSGAHRVPVAIDSVFDIDLVEAGQPSLHRAKRLLHAFSKGAADRHALANRFH